MSTTTASGYPATTTTGTLQDTLALVGRILVATLFVPAGFGKLMGFAGTVGYITSAGLPMPQVAAVVAILVELGVGLCFLFGFKTRAAALVLAVFTLATAVFFHNYWAMPPEKVQMMQINFFKNLAIAGGLLSFAVMGAGRFSIDRK
jgi:putative oxidoreductase